MAEADGRIGVGLIGYGFAGRAFHAPLVGAVPALRLARVASSRPDEVHADLPDAIVDPDPQAVIAAPDVELVVIASPNDSHAPLAEAALAAGKHVVVDKPFTITLAEARTLAARAEEAQRLLSVFHNRRWDTDFLSVRDAIAAGLVGELVHLESHFDRYRPHLRERWRESAQSGGGLWNDLGPHLIDQALLLMGLPDYVHVDLACQRDGAEVEDWVHAVLHFGEKRAILHASTLVAGGAMRFTAHGKGGSIVKPRLDQQEQQLLAGVRPGDADWGVDDDPLLCYGPDGACTSRPAARGDQSRYYAGVAAAIRGEAPNPVPPIQAVAVMAILQAGRISAASGARVPLPLTPAERAQWAASRGAEPAG